MEFEKSTGVCVWFSAKKGYGFIKPDNPIDDKDIFVHFSGLIMEGYKQLKAGDKVEYALQASGKGDIAVEVRVTEPAPPEEQTN